MNLLSLVKAKPVVSIVSGALVIATLAGGGVYLSQKKADELKKTETTTGSTQTVSSDTKVPEQNDKSQAVENTTVTTPATDTAATTSLNDVTLQGVNSDGGVDVTLYAEKGTFVVEKKVGNNWVQVIGQTNYLGTGGLSLNDLIPATEAQRIYRVYRVVSGKKVGPKEITVVKSVVIEKGSANFPSTGE